MSQQLIRSNRQRRALAALVKFGEVSSHDMRELAGALNVPELMAALRRNGWEWTCGRVEMQDRDGQKCRPGVYRLLPEHEKLAARILSGHPQAANSGDSHV